MKAISTSFLNWLIRKYPNNADLGKELRKRIENSDFSTKED